MRSKDEVYKDTKIFLWISMEEHENHEQVNAHKSAVDSHPCVQCMTYHYVITSS